MTQITIAATNQPSKPSRFLTQLAEAARRHGHSEASADELAQWCRRLILFQGKKHPQEMERVEIAAYLDHVARTEKDPVRAIEAAHRALEFLFGTFLQRRLGDLPWCFCIAMCCAWSWQLRRGAGATARA